MSKLHVDYRKIYYVLKELESLHEVYLKEEYRDDHRLNELFWRFKRWNDMQAVYRYMRYFEHIGYLKPRDEKESKPQETDISLFLLLLKGLFPEELILAVKAFRKILEHGSFLFGQESVKAMNDETNMCYAEHNDIVHLFKGSLGNYMAFGPCADMLFEHFGWQTSAVSFEGEQHSCMLLSEAGYQVACMEMTCYVSSTQLEIDFLKYEDEADVLLSLDQQMIDLFRKLIDDKGVRLYTRGALDPYVTVGSEEKQEDIRFPFMEVKPEKIYLFSDRADPFQLVYGHTWMVGQTDILMIEQITNLLYYQLIRHENDFDAIGKKEIGHGRGCVERYFEKQDLYPDKVLVMDFGGTFEAYGEDAVWLAYKYGFPLWLREDVDGHAITMVMMEEKQINRIMENDEMVVLDDAGLQDSIEMMALWPSSINLGLRDETKYKQVSIFKRKDGKYVIKASLGGKQLPPKELTDDIVNMYNAAKKGVMKEAVKKLILWRVYTYKKGRKDEPKENG